MYKLGVVGIGHWFGRLHEGIRSIGGLEIKSALGTRPYEAKRELLSKFGIKKEMYYTITDEGLIPDAFFSGVDAVHISDPNSEHAHQAIESLEKGKKVIVEKSFAVDKEEFDDFIGQVRSKRWENDVYLHLHYMHKLPVIELKNRIVSLSEKYGRITGISGTFFESANDEDANRGWLFSPQNGGLFMDWIHPFEVVYASMPTTFGKLHELGIFSVNRDYSDDYPTGIYASVGVSGRYFAPDARCAVRLCKGAEQRWARKSMRFTFESGNYVLLNFDGSEKEFTDGSRGGFEIGMIDGQEFKRETTVPLKGENTSEIFVREILGLCAGRNPGLSIKDIEGIFKPQWDYQSMAENTELVKDVRAVRRFLESGMKS